MRRLWIMLLVGGVSAGAAGAMPAAGSEQAWRTLAAGLELGEFKSSVASAAGDSIITVLRADPDQWEIRLLMRSQPTVRRTYTARESCETYGLAAATNAGMFQGDFTTHVGFMRSPDHVNSAGVNHYKSAAAFSPKQDSLPPFRMFDLDEIDLDDVKRRYGGVIQNLRLIKHPGENRWPQQEKRWSEAALGEDSSGRILFIFCRSPYSMHDLNDILLALPIDLVAAQHLEGGPEAQLYVKYGDVEWERCGSYETGFNEDDGNIRAWSIPNIIGIARRSP